jgi:hypothetical protein
LRPSRQRSCRRAGCICAHDAPYKGRGARRGRGHPAGIVREVTHGRCFCRRRDIRMGRQSMRSAWTNCIRHTTHSCAAASANAYASQSTLKIQQRGAARLGANTRWPHRYAWPPALFQLFQSSTNTQQWYNRSRRVAGRSVFDVNICVCDERKHRSVECIRDTCTAAAIRADTINIAPIVQRQRRSRELYVVWSHDPRSPQ